MNKKRKNQTVIVFKEENSETFKQIKIICLLKEISESEFFEALAMKNAEKIKKEYERLLPSEKTKEEE